MKASRRHWIVKRESAERFSTRSGDSNRSPRVPLLVKCLSSELQKTPHARPIRRNVKRQFWPRAGLERASAALSLASRGCLDKNRLTVRICISRKTLHGTPSRLRRENKRCANFGRGRRKNRTTPWQRSSSPQKKRDRVYAPQDRLDCLMPPVPQLRPGVIVDNPAKITCPWPEWKDQVSAGRS